MNFIEKLRARHAALLAERTALIAEDDAITALVETESRDALTDVETTRHREIVARATAIVGELDQIEADITERTALAQERADAPKGPNFIPAPTQPTPEDTRNMNSAQIIDATAKALEAREVDPTQARKVLHAHRTNRDWLRSLAARSTDIYADAWVKMVTGRRDELTAEERTAMSVGSNTNGGYLVPTHLDPTIILTSAGSANVMRQYATVKTLTVGNTWHGVNSAGVTISWDGEIVEVSDDTATIGSLSIPTFKAQGFQQASIEAFEDIAGLTSDAMMLFADARDVLEGAAHMTGNGTTAPKGIFTAADANTNCEITSTTAATIGLVDLQAIKRAVPQRWRNQSQYLMNPVYGDAIKTLGTAVSASFSGDLTQANTDRISNLGVVETDDAPSAQTTTVRDNEIICGPLRNYFIIDLPGSYAVEYVPMLFSTTTNLPDGRRGWYMHFRSGGDVPNVTSLRLLQDKTSA